MTNETTMILPIEREQLDRTLVGRGASLPSDLAGWSRLARDAASLRPSVLDELEHRMSVLRLAFDVEWAAQDVDVAELLDDLVLPFARSRVPFRPRAEATAWAHQKVLEILEQFQSTGVVHRQIDRDGRPTSDEPNPPAVIARVALAAGWIAWSELLVSPRTTRSFMGLLTRALDVIEERMQRDDWNPEARDLDLALAALRLERRLLRHGRATLAAAY